MTMMDRERPSSRLQVIAVGVLAFNMAVLLNGCGSSGRSGKQGGPAPCAPQQARYSSSALPVLTSAALLSAVVEVSGPRASTPKCVGLASGSTVTLRIGDSAEFVANQVPSIDPAGTSIVSVATRPGPTSSGPGDVGGLRTTHVIVRLTAEQPGQVRVRWIDCSGTGC